MTDVLSPLTGVVVSVNVAVGDRVRAGQTVAVLESMKMEHVVEATADGVVTALLAKEGDNLSPGDAVLSLAPSRSGDSPPEAADHRISVAPNLEGRADLAEVVARHEVGL